MLGLGKTLPLSRKLGGGYGPELYTYGNALSDPAGTEVDSLSGITAGGLAGVGNFFISQGVVKNAGSYAVRAECNAIPTPSARIYFDLTAPKFNFVDGEHGKIEFDVRHVGVGGVWTAYLAPSTFGVTNKIVEIVNTDVAFIRYKYEFVYDANHRYFLFREKSDEHDGGIYTDNYSVKKKNRAMTPTIDVNFTTDQFVFKFKMSSSDKITIEDGDGASTTYDGLDGTTITHTTTYATPGNYTFQITAGFERITFLDLRFQEWAGGSAANFRPPTDCTEFRIYGCSFYGDASAWKFNPSMTILMIDNNGGQNKGDGLSGDISNWDIPFTTITEFRISNNSFTGDISDWVFSNLLISKINCLNNSLTGSMPNISFRASAALEYIMGGNYFTGSNIDEFRPAMTQFEINDQRAAFPTSSIDALLKDIADYFQTNAPSADCVFDFRGINMGIPTGGAANADKVRIEGYYTSEGQTAWVYVNESDPAFDNGKLIITFDGNVNPIYTVGFPVFVAKSKKCTIYTWTDGVSASGMYSWANIIEMDGDGMDMQGHSQTHTDITTLSEQQLTDELIAVNAAFVANGLAAPDHMAYPFGDSDSETDAIVDNYRLTGTEYTFDYQRPFEYKNAIKYSIKRYWIDDRADRSFDLSAFKTTMDEAMVNKAALIAISHAVNSANDYQYSAIKQSDLEAIIDYADEIGMDIITHSEFYNLLD